MDYKKSQYNDARLNDFIRLFSSVKSNSEDEKVGLIIETAMKQGTKLPETKAKTQLEAVNELYDSYRY